MIPNHSARPMPGSDTNSAVPDLTRFRNRPIGFLWYYVLQHKLGHAVVIGSVILAVIASVRAPPSS